MKIMIVDDHEPMRRLIKQLVVSTLTDDSVLCECSSGEDAIEKNNSFLPDCLIMDYQLKQMNGFEATEIIMQINPNVHVIMISSYDSHQMRKKAQKMKIQGFISKEQLHEIPNYFKSLTLH